MEEEEGEARLREKLCFSDKELDIAAIVSLRTVAHNHKIEIGYEGKWHCNTINQIEYSCTTSWVPEGEGMDAFIGKVYYNNNNNNDDNLIIEWKMLRWL